jgi:hypothetical protein|uniref:Uncharacterized protein n=1 Tax=Zea mays TaxID=4577 RepID=B4FEP6_MAIZE|nr:unknown [Zea mays]
MIQQLFPFPGIVLFILDSSSSMCEEIAIKRVFVALLGSPCLQVLLIAGSVLQMQSHRGLKFVVQETDKEIQG